MTQVDRRVLMASEIDKPDFFTLLLGLVLKPHGAVPEENASLGHRSLLNPCHRSK